MNDPARMDSVIRINTIGGVLVLGATGLAIALLLFGARPLEPRLGANLLFGVAIGSILLMTARSARRDRDDPAGVEGRFQSGALAWSAVLLIAGFLAVVGVTTWGLLR